MLRAGAAEGRVSGLFEIRDARVAAEIRRVADLPGEDATLLEEPLLITRKLFASGRSSVSINGQPVTTAMLREVGELLIDIHASPESASAPGGESQFLLRPSNQLEVLDAFAGHEHLREECAAAYHSLRESREQLEAAHSGGALRAEQLDLAQFQAAEIDVVEPTRGEYEELAARHRVLSQVEKIIRQAGAVHAGLYEAENSVTSRLQIAVGVLRELAELDPALREVAELAESATVAVQDASYTLGRYLGRLDLDPVELAEVTDRLNALNRLIAKYSQGRGGRLEDVIEFRAQLQCRIEELGGAQDSVESLEARVAEQTAQVEAIAARLCRGRIAAAERLKPLIEAELRELAMADARFDVDVRSLTEPAATGLDHVEMMIQTNPGQPSRPLRRVASGGELSRLMLALKTVLARAERVSVLVFDEIDAKIGGRLGAVIGAKLQALARRHQVLCITHLPQIAAFADHHLKIEKRTTGGKETRTTVMALTDDESRIAELAEMLAGRDATGTTFAQARELLDLARQHPSERKPASKSDRAAEVVVAPRKRERRKAAS